MVNIDNDRKAVCTCFGSGEWEKGRKKLFMMYNTKLNKLDNIEDIRFIVYNLAWVELHLENINSSRQYIKEIKDIFENKNEHIDNYPSEYCRILDIYNITHKDVISVDEKIKLYEQTYAIYCKLDSVDKYMALHNIYHLKKEYYKIPNLLKEILNNVGEHQEFINDILEGLKEKNDSAYKQALDEIESYRLSNTSVTL